MLNFEDDFTPANQAAAVPAFLRKEAAPVGADVSDAPAAPETKMSPFVSGAAITPPMNPA